MPGVTKRLARDLRPHGINAVAPGAAGSEDWLFAARPQEYNDWVLARHCVKARSLVPDLANLAEVLA